MKDRFARSFRSHFPLFILAVICASLAAPGVGGHRAAASQEVPQQGFQIFLPLISRPSPHWSNSSQGLPVDANFYALALSPDFLHDQVVFAGTYNYTAASSSGHVYRSDSGGASWAATGPGMVENMVFTLAVSPDFTHDHTLFAGSAPTCSIPALYRSTDSGSSWQIAGNLLEIVEAVVISPAYGRDRTVFTTDGHQVFKSTDGGDTWNAVYTSQPTYYDLEEIALSPHFDADATLFLGKANLNSPAAGPTLLRSTDGGAHWQELDTPPSWLSIGEIDLSPGYPADHTLFVREDANGLGLFRSTDDGATWQPLKNRLSVYPYTFTLSPDFIQDGTLFAATDHGVYRSRNRGDSWQKVGADGETCLNLVVSPAYASDATVLASCDHFIASTDGGDHWTVRSPGVTVDVLDVERAPGNGVMFTAMDMQGIYKSVDNGHTWEARNNGLDYLVTYEVAVSPNFTADGIVFASDAWKGTSRSADGGDTWIKVAPQVGRLAISPAFASDHLVLLSTGGGVFRSQDDGLTWGKLPDFTAYAKLAFSPGYAFDHKIIAITGFPDQLWISTDEGEYWTPSAMSTQAGIIQWSPGKDPILISSNIYGGISLSYDLGKTWAVQTQLGVESAVTAYTSSPNYENDHTLYLATASAGVFASEDGGVSWQPVNLGLPALRINQILALPGSSGELLVGTDSGVWQLGY